jgi:PAS domain S-box-containing protein
LHGPSEILACIENALKPHGFPANEVERLRALQDYRILDSGSESAFDDLAVIAAHILQVPTALVSLVDADREWFLARYGLGATQMPRRNSFCGYIVEDDESLVIPDALADERFMDHPAVIGAPNVRFYAGMPLRTPEGYVLGSLCVLDTLPHEPTTVQLDMLGLLAKQVMLLLEKRRARLMIDASRSLAVAGAKRLEATFDVMAEGVVVQDASGAILSSNAAACEILGLTDDQLNGRTSLDPRWRSVREDGSPFPGAEHPAMQAIATGERQRNVVMGVNLPDGSVTWISINAMPSEFVDGKVSEVVTTFHDITPIKTAAEKMAVQERLAATGTLVAGVGHEINNPLAFIIANLDLTLEELRLLAGPSPSARLLDLIEMVTESRAGADRIRRIVRGLRSLVREDVALHAVNLAQIAETSCNMSMHELRHRATVEVNVADAPLVLGDETRLTQVVMNLLVNAAQAFRDSDPERNLVEVTASLMSDATVRMTISDNGPGITAETAARMFDPFFTTKAVGDGTGLGLAVSRGIVHGLGGHLSYEPRVGGGAAFHIDLPAAEPDVEMELAPTTEVSAPRGRILIIDDDAMVLSTIRRTLRREHDVTAIRDPREAVAVLATGQGFEMILCDLMMPHLNGAQVFDEVKRLRPELADRVVFTTGGATTASSATFLAGLANDIVEKPFSVMAIMALARRYVLRYAQ